jgi:3-dehydroquinate synthase
VKTIAIKASTGDSTILIGEALQNLSHYLPSGHVVVITDTNVWNLYGKEFPPVDVIQITQGEEIKTLRTVETVYDRLIQLKADRSTFLVGIGGGIVCDIAGFVASTYMRGIEFGYVATTLLAQVDASVGGKNGVNFGGYKNMVGVFHQPEFVICDLSLLKTLPKKEISCGFAEIIKHAAIADYEMFSFLETNPVRALSLEMDVLEKLIHESVKIKASVVAKDEKEKGERRKLNFGHTFGHAIEKTTGISHGEAVSLGMVLASAISVQKSLLTGEDHLKLINLLERYLLPTQAQINNETLWDALKKDKKRASDRMHFVLLQGLGRAMIKNIPIGDVKGYLELFSERRSVESLDPMKKT